MKVAIIGGGISGVISSIYASKNNDVTIFERNDSLLKKLLLTGNGRCNYFNDNRSIDNYNSSNMDLLKNIINDKSLDRVLEFYDSIGIIPKIKNGYYYPMSNMAISVKEALLKEVRNRKIKVITNSFIKNIEIKNNKFIINKEIFDKVIISVGGSASYKTGSDGNMLFTLEKMGHDILKPLPALVQLKGEESYFKDWTGIRVDACVSLYENDKFIKKETGELQLTNYGLSGICIFNLSSKVSRGLDNNRKEDIVINFLPNIDNLEEFLDNRNKKLKNRTILELLEALINYKLVKVILKKSNIKENISYDSLDIKSKKELIKNLESFKVNITGTNDFLNAQVSSGGVLLNNININTMESLKVKNLYLIGEVLDVDGLCGGYNIMFATITGIIAGENI